MSTYFPQLQRMNLENSKLLGMIFALVVIFASIFMACASRVGAVPKEVTELLVQQHHAVQDMQQRMQAIEQMRQSPSRDVHSEIIRGVTVVVAFLLVGGFWMYYDAIQHDRACQRQCETDLRQHRMRQEEREVAYQKQVDEERRAYQKQHEENLTRAKSLASLSDQTKSLVQKGAPNAQSAFGRVKGTGVKSSQIRVFKEEFCSIRLDEEGIKTIMRKVSYNSSMSPNIACAQRLERALNCTSAEFQYLESSLKVLAKAQAYKCSEFFFTDDSQHQKVMKIMLVGQRIKDSEYNILITMAVAKEVNNILRTVYDWGAGGKIIGDRQAVCQEVLDHEIMKMFPEKDDNGVYSGSQGPGQLGLQDGATD